MDEDEFDVGPSLSDDSDMEIQPQHTMVVKEDTVSYTHLTLPTICSV